MRTIAVVILLAAATAGCQTNSGAACDGWTPIRPSRADVAKLSDSAVAQILANNEHGRKVCGWKPR